MLATVFRNTDRAACARGGHNCSVMEPKACAFVGEWQNPDTARPLASLGRGADPQPNRAAVRNNKDR